MSGLGHRAGDPGQASGCATAGGPLQKQMVKHRFPNIRHIWLCHSSLPTIKISAPPTHVGLAVPGTGPWAPAVVAYLALHERLPQALSPALRRSPRRVPVQPQLAHALMELLGLAAPGLQKLLAAHVGRDHQSLVGVQGVQDLLPQKERLGEAL